MSDDVIQIVVTVGLIKTSFEISTLNYFNFTIVHFCSLLQFQQIEKSR